MTSNRKPPGAGSARRTSRVDPKARSARLFSTHLADADRSLPGQLDGRADRCEGAAEAAGTDAATPTTVGGKPLLLTVPEAAWELRLQRRFLDRAIEQEQVRVVYLGRAKRIPRSEVERLAREGLPAPAGPKPSRLSN